MRDVRFTLDRDQLGLLLNVLDNMLSEEPRGEMLNMLHSILEVVAVRLRRRHAERRHDYKLILPVFQALALRRVALAAQVFYTGERERREMLLLSGVIDKQVAGYIHL